MKERTKLRMKRRTRKDESQQQKEGKTRTEQAQENETLRTRKDWTTNDPKPNELTRKAKHRTGNSFSTRIRIWATGKAICNRSSAHTKSYTKTEHGELAG